MWRVPGATALCLLLAAGAVQWSIAKAVAAAGREASLRFGAEPAAALARLVNCEECGLKVRDRAVWALGEMEDRRALPLLRSRLSRRKCDHEHGLCQYELGKAIRKIEGTWSVPRRIRL